MTTNGVILKTVDGRSTTKVIAKDLRKNFKRIMKMKGVMVVVVVLVVLLSVLATTACKGVVVLKERVSIGKAVAVASSGASLQVVFTSFLGIT